MFIPNQYWCNCSLFVFQRLFRVSNSINSIDINGEEGKLAVNMVRINLRLVLLCEIHQIDRFILISILRYERILRSAVYQKYTNYSMQLKNCKTFKLGKTLSWLFWTSGKYLSRQINYSFRLCQIVEYSRIYISFRFL